MPMYACHVDPRKHRLASKRVNLDTLARKIAGMFDIAPDELFMPGRYPIRVKARSLLFFWAVRELGLTATELARKAGMTQPAVSMAVKRGERFAKVNKLSIDTLF